MWFPFDYSLTLRMNFILRQQESTWVFFQGRHSRSWTGRRSRDRWTGVASGDGPRLLAAVRLDRRLPRQAGRLHGLQLVVQGSNNFSKDWLVVDLRIVESRSPCCPISQCSPLKSTHQFFCLAVVGQKTTSSRYQPYLVVLNSLEPIFQPNYLLGIRTAALPETRTIKKAGYSLGS